VLSVKLGEGEMTNDSRKALPEGINNFRLKTKFYESLRLFEAAKDAGSLAGDPDLKRAVPNSRNTPQRRSCI
jgi:hypothetical protein